MLCEKKSPLYYACEESFYLFPRREVSHLLRRSTCQQFAVCCQNSCREMVAFCPSFLPGPDVARTAPSILPAPSGTVSCLPAAKWKGGSNSALAIALFRIVAGKIAVNVKKAVNVVGAFDQPPTHTQFLFGCLLGLFSDGETER